MQRATLQETPAQQPNTSLVDAVGAVAVLVTGLFAASYPVTVAALAVGTVGSYVGALALQRIQRVGVRGKTTAVSDSVAKNAQ